MRTIQQNKFVRFVLRAIDICVALYIPRRIHWEREPFQKATATQWRVGWFCVAWAPIIMLVFGCSHSIHSFLDTAEAHSIVWLYLAFIAFGLITVLCIVKVGPIIPLYISVPTGLTAWIIC